MRQIDGDRLIEYIKAWGIGEGIGHGQKDFLRAIEEQPTVEAEPVVHGEWIKQKPNEEVMNAFHAMGIGKGMSAKSIYWTCSECGGWGTLTHKFCSKCGAKMDGKAV